MIAITATKVLPFALGHSVNANPDYRFFGHPFPSCASLSGWLMVSVEPDLPRSRSYRSSLHRSLICRRTGWPTVTRQRHQLMSSERSSGPTSRVFSNWLEQLVSRRFATPSFIPPCSFVNYLTSITINHSHALRTFIVEMVCHAVVDRLFDKCTLGKMKF